MPSRIIPMAVVLCLFAGALCAAPSVVSVSPAANSMAGLNASPTATFDETVQNPATGQAQVFSDLRGDIGGNWSAQGSNLAFNPSTDWLPNEHITIVLTTAVQGASGNLAQAFIWEFQTKSGKGPADFTVNSTTLGGTGKSVVCGDVNGDGVLDAVFNDANLVKVQLGTGTGNFGSMSSMNTGPITDLAMGDVDADGDLDLAVSLDDANAPNRLYINDGNGNFGGMRVLGSVVLYTIALAMADLDGDGDLDVVSANGGLGRERNVWYENDGSGNFTNEYYFGSQVAADNSWDVACGDFDGDGDMDCAFANYGLGAPGQSYAYLNDGTGGFDAQHRNAVGTPAINGALALGDFDLDGILDFAIGSHNGTNNAIYLGDGTGKFGTSVNFPTRSVSPAITGLSFCDANGDGQPDLYVSRDFRQDTIEINNGTGGFTTNAKNIGSGSSRLWTAELVDVDNDGDTDAVVPGILFMNGTTAPSFSVLWQGSTVTDGDTISVPEGASLASQAPIFTVVDPDANTTLTLTATISNHTTQGFILGEFGKSGSSPTQSAPYTGTFNVGNVTHTIVMTASDGADVAEFTIHAFVVPTIPPGLPEASSSGNPLVSGGTLDMGQRIVTEAAAVSTITITNAGQSSMTISLPLLGGADAQHFSLDTTAINLTLNPSASTSFDVLYSATVAGLHTADLTFTHNGGGTSPYTINLQGESIQPPSPPPGPGPGSSTGSGGSGGGGCVSAKGHNLGWLLIVGLLAPFIWLHRKATARI